MHWLPPRGYPETRSRMRAKQVYFVGKLIVGGRDNRAAYRVRIFTAPRTSVVLLSDIRELVLQVLDQNLVIHAEAPRGEQYLGGLLVVDAELPAQEVEDYVSGSRGEECVSN